TADGPEHVPSENPRAHVLEAQFRHPIVHAGFAAAEAVHVAPDPGVEEPLHQLRTSYAERLLEALIESGGEAVKRDDETANADDRHGQISPWATRNAGSR